MSINMSKWGYYIHTSLGGIRCCDNSTSPPTDPETPATAWRVKTSSATCVLSGGLRTGYVQYTLLEQYTVSDDVATGVTKVNFPSDPDYVANSINTTLCPVQSPTPLPNECNIINTIVCKGNVNTVGGTIDDTRFLVPYVHVVFSVGSYAGGLAKITTTLTSGVDPQPCLIQYMGVLYPSDGYIELPVDIGYTIYIRPVGYVIPPVVPDPEA